MLARFWFQFFFLLTEVLLLLVKNPISAIPITGLSFSTNSRYFNAQCFSALLKYRQEDLK
jgi:hypothetical protein